MLGSIGTKNGTILYYIWYGTILGCHVTNGVTSCDQPKCWLTDVGLVTKLGCGQICCTCTPICVVGVFSTTSYKKVISFFLINFFNLSSTKG
jgi:hypothetical protein